MSDVTQILAQIENGDTAAAERLLPLVYRELRRLAEARLSREAPGQTLQATALVHEVYLRLLGASSPNWQSKAHFFGAAAEAMRRILIDAARKKATVRHGGQMARVQLDQLDLADHAPSDDILALDEALERLAQDEPIVAKVVSLRYFAGLTIEQTASALDLSVRTVNRHWVFAKAWLLRELNQ